MSMGAYFSGICDDEHESVFFQLIMFSDFKNGKRRIRRRRRRGCGAVVLALDNDLPIRFFIPNLVPQRGIVFQMAVEFFHLRSFLFFFFIENAILDMGRLGGRTHRENFFFFIFS